MKQMFFMLLAVLMAGACTQKNGYNISGLATNTSGSELFLEKISQKKREVIDTVTLSADGNFSMKGPLDQEMLFRLRNEQNNGIVLHLQPGSNVQVTMDFDDLDNYTVSGSEESIRFKDFNTYYVNRNKEKQALIQQYREEQDSLTKANIVTKLQAWDVQTVEDVKQRITEEPSGLLGLLMMSVVPAQNNKQFYNDFNDRLQSEYPNSDYAKEFNDRVAQVNSMIEPPKMGETAPEIAMANPKGEILKLSDLRGKYVLVDFWAAWCGPCRKENPNVVAAYKTFNNKGFEVFNVSLDRTSQQWVRAIEQDNLDWPYHVSDLKYWNNAAAKQYGVKSIPANFLLDPEGKVVASNLRGAALQAKLAEIFN